MKECKGNIMLLAMFWNKNEHLHLLEFSAENTGYLLCKFNIRACNFYIKVSINN